MQRGTWAGALAAVAVGVLGVAPGASGDEYGDYARVRGDWQPDRVLTACRFTVSELENARSVLTGEDNYSGLQGAIEDEIRRQRTGGCPGGGGVEGLPVVSRVRFVPAVFRAARGSRLRFELSKASAVRIVVERRAGSRWVRVRTLVRTGRRAGANTVVFAARGLAPGAYRATLTAFADGDRSVLRRAAFRIVR